MKDRIHKDLESGHPLTRLLYVTPELCSTDRFRHRLQIVYKQKELARVVIDEAHCISEWGHNFRRDFLRLIWFRETFPDVPIMCLTATANARVREDILTTLGVHTENLKSFILTPHRPNIHLEIRYTQDKNDNRLSDFVRWMKWSYEKRRGLQRKAELDQINERVENVPGIIYTMSRSECESLATQLREAGIGARPFHAKLPQEVKEETLTRWINNNAGYDVIVATTAFGMGIDKENVRFVVHWRLPKSFEGYYQEVGRAGRDGNASYCFLYYSREDFERAQSLVRSSGQGGNFDARMESLRQLGLYCENVEQCRHTFICKYFDEDEAPHCDLTCDWHKECVWGKDPTALRKRMEVGLAEQEWVSTQAKDLGNDGYDDD